MAVLSPGSAGVAPSWMGNGRDADHWRDFHFRINGPVVAQMQAVFMKNRLKATGRATQREDYFSAL